MANKGLFGGNPNIIWDSPCDVVMKMYHYANFQAVLDTTRMVINTNKDK
jgi:hypothetical protein|nr:MAG TPA: hypothetical protein [Caudoviricetes sp.]DAH89640.1 MAG TPA: hypothetical protein [Caudoviricetes sp.]DAY68239.1 MAG TPA: hypothetical protein [Caudoviricetes sp.]